MLNLYDDFMFHQHDSRCSNDGRIKQYTVQAIGSQRVSESRWGTTRSFSVPRWWLYKAVQYEAKYNLTQHLIGSTSRQTRESTGCWFMVEHWTTQQRLFIGILIKNPVDTRICAICERKDDGISLFDYRNFELAVSWVWQAQTLRVVRRTFSTNFGGLPISSSDGSSMPFL